MSKKKAPEWIVWEEVVSSLPGDVQSFMDLLGVTYVDHTDSTLVIATTEKVTSGDAEIIVRGMSAANLAFDSATFVASAAEWAKSPASYQGRKWRVCRYATLLQQGNWCRCCGARPPGVELHVDHIIPKSIDPSKAWDLSNLQVLCKDCNLGKGNGDSRDWRCEVAKA